MSDVELAEFKEALAFVRMVKANPALLAFYEPIANQHEATMRVVAMGDRLKQSAIKPPDLSNYKGQIGDVVEIRTTDDLSLAGLNGNMGCITRQNEIPISASS